MLPSCGPPMQPPLAGQANAAQAGQMAAAPSRAASVPASAHADEDEEGDLAALAAAAAEPLGMLGTLSVRQVPVEGLQVPGSLAQGDPTGCGKMYKVCGTGAGGVIAVAPGVSLATRHKQWGDSWGFACSSQ